MTISAATTVATTAIIQPCFYSTVIAECHQASTTIPRQQLSMLQLREDWPLCSRMPPTQAKQLTVSSGTRGKSAEGPSEGSYTTDGPRQLHHRGGDSHGRRSVSEYVLPQHPIVILFDSGASHDFMGFTCAKKAKLSLVASGAPYMISNPGGRVDAIQVVYKVPLKLSERIFSTNLIILSGQRIDVILWMSWMKAHRAVLDIAGQLVHLDSPVYGKVILHLHVISCINASLHHVVELKLEDIHVIQEYLDVFPDELPGMSPKRAIEFNIEL
jgi:hypothetical protein